MLGGRLDRRPRRQFPRERHSGAPLPAEIVPDGRSQCIRAADVPGPGLRPHEKHTHIGVAQRAGNDPGVLQRGPHQVQGAEPLPGRPAHGVPEERRDPVGRTTHPHSDRAAGPFRPAHGLRSPLRGRQADDHNRGVRGVRGDGGGVMAGLGPGQSAGHGVSAFSSLASSCVPVGRLRVRSGCPPPLAPPRGRLLDRQHSDGVRLTRP